MILVSFHPVLQILPKVRNKKGKVEFPFLFWKEYRCFGAKGFIRGPLTTRKVTAFPVLERDQFTLIQNGSQILGPLSPKIFLDPITNR